MKGFSDEWAANVLGIPHTTLDVSEFTPYQRERIACVLAGARAAAAAMSSGYALVPLKLTNAMTSDLANALEDPANERSSWDLAENMYRAVLAAGDEP